MTGKWIRMRRGSLALLVIVLALLIAAYRLDTGSEAVARQRRPTFTTEIPAPSAAVALPRSASNPGDVSNDCPITRPQTPAFVPPLPWPPKAPYGEFWYGTNALWTSLRPDGKWWALPHAVAGYTQKVWFWKQGYNGHDDPNPKLIVTGRRLDGSAPSLVASQATNGYHPDFNWAMLVGVDVPTLGCWEITGAIDGHELSFAVWVAP